MAMTAGNTNGYRAEINVTPMIDVLLVLLIIFMVVAPVTPVGLNARIPQPATTPGPALAQDIVVDVVGAGAVELNTQPMGLDELQVQLRRIFEARGNTVIFVRGAGSLDYRDVAAVIDIARGAGLLRVGLMTSR